MTTIGVLALQGDFAEHAAALRAAGADAVEVRLPNDLAGLQGLVIPGGESTTITRLMVGYELLEPLRVLAAQQFPIWGTCAGAIVLARNAVGLDQPNIGAMDITIRRNAFGSQIDSFETDLAVPALDVYGHPPSLSHVADEDAGAEEHSIPFHAVFIRAPVIEDAGPGVEVLARLPDGRMVAARQGRLLATSFHPELTRDLRFHRYFLDLAQRAPAVGSK